MTVILVPPGVGDSYWSIVKLQALIQRDGLDHPFVSPLAAPDPKYHGDTRSIPFLELFPFIRTTGMSVSAAYTKATENIIQEAYTTPGKTVFRNVFGCDYFVSYIGCLCNGHTLEEADDLACDWTPQMTIFPEQETFKKQCLELYGRYIVYYFPFYGMYKLWLQEFSLDDIVTSIQQITVLTGCRPLFVGATWDIAENPILQQVIDKIPEAVDLRGTTTLRQAFGCCCGAQAFVGYQAGLGMMANVMGTKTLLIWNDFIHRGMATNSMPPETRGTRYFVTFTSEMTVPSFVTQVVDMVK